MFKESFESSKSVDEVSEAISAKIENGLWKSLFESPLAIQIISLDKSVNSIYAFIKMDNKEGFKWIKSFMK